MAAGTTDTDFKLLLEKITPVINLSKDGAKAGRAFFRLYGLVTEMTRRNIKDYRVDLLYQEYQEISSLFSGVASRRVTLLGRNSGESSWMKRQCRNLKFKSASVSDIKNIQKRLDEVVNSIKTFGLPDLLDAPM